MGVAEGQFQEKDVCKTEAGTKADVKGEDVYVIGGVEEVGVSGYESEGVQARKNLSSQKTCKKVYVRGCG